MRKKGYTLIEVLVALAITGILFSLLIVVANTFSRSHRYTIANTDRMREVNQVHNAFDGFMNHVSLSGAELHLSGKEELQGGNLKITYDITQQQLTYENQNNSAKSVLKFKKIKDIEISADNRLLTVKLRLDNDQEIKYLYSCLKTIRSE